MRSKFCAAVAAVAIGWSMPAPAAETQIGEPVVMHGMQIGALYIQAVKMDMGHGGHGGHSMTQATTDQGGHGHGDTHQAGALATEGDLHLEADIRAATGNEWGFPDGVWIPYLTVDWTLTKKGSDWAMNGRFLPMIASDGPHYGDNLMLDGPGKYALTYRVSPPDAAVFPRHFDKETGASDWWTPFEVSWEFVFTGTGKKGGY